MLIHKILGLIIDLLGARVTTAFLGRMRVVYADDILDLCWSTAGNGRMGVIMVSPTRTELVDYMDCKFHSP